MSWDVEAAADCSLRVLAPDPCPCGRCDGAPYYWETYRHAVKVNGGVARTGAEAQRLAWLHITGETAQRPVRLIAAV